MLFQREQNMSKEIKDECLHHQEMLLLKPGIFNNADHRIIHVVSIQTRAQSRQQEISTESPPEDAKIVEPELQKESSKIIELKFQRESSKIIELNSSIELLIKK